MMRPLGALTKTPIHGEAGMSEVERPRWAESEYEDDAADEVLDGEVMLPVYYVDPLGQHDTVEDAITDELEWTFDGFIIAEDSSEGVEVAARVALAVTSEAGGLGNGQAYVGEGFIGLWWPPEEHP